MTASEIDTHAAPGAGRTALIIVGAITTFFSLMVLGCLFLPTVPLIP